MSIIKINRLDKKAIAWINHLRRTKRNFKLYVSNYAITIEYENGEKLKYLRELKSDRFFAYAKMIEKEVIASDNFLNIICSDLSGKKAEYFSNRFLMPEILEPSRIFNIDINAAYPSTLFASELISFDLLRKLMRLPKTDRLAAVGMLAANKQIFEYVRGELISHHITSKPTEPVFNFCVNYIDSIILDISRIAPDKFIFYWVDGIYFTEKPNKEQMREIEYQINEVGLKFKTEWLEKFTLKYIGGNLSINYLKEGKPKKFLFPNRHFIDAKNFL